jgi:dihydroflavonol-4-reductase
VIGPDDFSKSEFGTLCYRFWRGRIPFHFGGGNNFVDVRDVAMGHLLAAERGRPGERYILGGVNRTLTSFFGDLARVAGRAIFRMRLPRGVGSVVAMLADRGRKKGRRSYLTASQARLLSLYFFYDCRKANRELGYQTRPFSETTRETHRFWIQKKSA